MKPGVSLVDHDHDRLDHVVQFYRDEQELAASVSRYLSDGIRRGEPAIVIATPEHRAAFRTALTDLGFGDAAVTELDAAEALSGLLVDGHVDRASFQATVGAVVRAASRSGERVCAYGEMVALLWSAGHVASAIELEDVWNSLLREVSLSLYCAYPSEIARDAAPSTALDEIYRVHSGVTGRSAREPSIGDRPSVYGEVTSHFLRSPRAPRAARRFTASVLEGSGLDGLAYDVMIVVSELSANAVQHAGSDFSVTIRIDDDALFVGVADASPFPALRRSSGLATSGRGLGLVDALADRWGTDPAESGKLVWAEFRRDRGSST